MSKCPPTIVKTISALCSQTTHRRAVLTWARGDVGSSSAECREPFALPPLPFDLLPSFFPSFSVVYSVPGAKPAGAWRYNRVIWSSDVLRRRGHVRLVTEQGRAPIAEVVCYP